MREVIERLVSLRTYVCYLQRLHIALMIPCEEEMQTVLDNWSAKGNTILISREIVSTTIATDVILAAKLICSGIDKCRTRERIGARLADSIDDSSSCTTVSHVVCVGHYLELTYCLHAQCVRTTLTHIGSTSRNRVL